MTVAGLTAAGVRISGIGKLAQVVARAVDELGLRAGGGGRGEAPDSEPIMAMVLPTGVFLPTNPAAKAAAAAQTVKRVRV